MVTPNTKSTFTSTTWNSAGRAKHSTNAAKFGGPNVNITEGSKVQFVDGDIVWDVARVFDDGSLHLTAVASGRKMTSRIEAGSDRWERLRMVNGKNFPVPGQDSTQPSRGGGPNKNIEVGEVVVLGETSVRWTVESVKGDGTLRLYTMSGDKLTYASVAPKSRFWEAIRAISG